jgi:hypothetical protein
MLNVQNQLLITLYVPGKNHGFKYHIEIGEKPNALPKITDLT